MTRRAGGKPDEEIGRPDAPAAAGASEPGARLGRRLLAAGRPTKRIRDMTPNELRAFAEQAGDLMAGRAAAARGRAGNRRRDAGP